MIRTTKNDEIEKLGEKWLRQMNPLAKQQEEWKNQGHGEYREIPEEKCATSTWRCKIVDKHLVILAPQALRNKVINPSVEWSPFLCESLKILVIPTIAIVIDAKTKDYIKGFDDLGGTDDFPTEMLEWRLGCAGVINYI